VQLALSPATDWLLENFYVVERALRQVREDMPRGYYRRLPKLDTSLLEGYPRVYAIAREIIRHCEGHLDLDQVARFVRAYQRVTPLTIGELWALPTMLRLGILEGLARVLASIIESQVSEGPPDVVAESWHKGLEDEAVVVSCIISLQALAIQDWEVFFESVSRMEQILGHDPARVYPRLDFDTRDLYRGIVEKLALVTGQGEEEVAWEAIKLAREEFVKHREGKDGTRDLPRTVHIGYYLLNVEGRVQLEARLGYRPPWRVRLSRWLDGHPALLYLGGISFLSLLILFGLVSYAFVAGGTLIQLITVSLLAAVPVTVMAVNLVNWLVTHTVSPQQWPRLNFQEEGIPAECRTMIVVPALLTDAGAVESLLQQLELHFLRNTDANLRFALLSDFTDAPEEHMPDDGALLEQATASIRELNKKYGRQTAGPFYLFHRKREWNPAEECYMGWERKRGKLVEFNRLLGGGETSYDVQIGDLDVLPEIKYVITLDADTVLPRDGARRLVAALAHPLNRAEFDLQSGAVVAGYTVLQPRVEIRPTSAGRSLFTQVFSGDAGLDLYTRAVSDVYQDLFGAGIYAGKGIYDVTAFERSLAGRVPENALLSHDLFEGVHGRAGLVTDVILYEDYPAHYLAYTRRFHRWVRGDWQLLPWLLPEVPHADGGRIPNDLSVLDRWKILDNLRRSLLTPALLALLIAGWLWLPGSELVWTLVGLLALGAPTFAGLVTVLWRGLRGGALRGTWHLVRIGVLRWILGWVFLLYETLIIVDAVVATLVRLTITRKRLLQWTTAAHTARLFGRETKLGLLWKQMGAATLLALALDLLVLMVNPAALLVAVPFLFAWMMSPYVAYWISRPLVHKRASLSPDQRQQLRRLARRTWLYFERFVGPDDQWLPPDHFQEEPLGLVAHRTSPTNVGLLLLSTLAAYDLGYIGSLDLVLRLRPTFESIDKLARHRDHLMNWYDTRNLKPLSPRYVSTVDSGNLAACMLTLKQGCQDLSRAPIFCWRRWEGLLDTLDVLAEVVEGVRDRTEIRVEAKELQNYLKHIRWQVLAAQDNLDDQVLLLGRLGGDGWQELERLLIALVGSSPRTLDAAILRDLRIWSERVNYQLVSIQTELDLLLPWLVLFSQPPALFAQAGTDPTIADAWQSLIDALSTSPRLDGVPEVCRMGRARLDHLQNLLADHLLTGEAGLTDQSPPKLVAQAQEARDWCRHLSDELYSAQMVAESLLIGLQDLGAQAEENFQAIEFRFLFDPRLQVLHIGYHVEAEALDANHYGLLASESWITSLLAIAKGDILQSHWMHLGRPLTRVNGSRALLSWNGTMFEYLMPSLLARRYEGTLLDQSDRAIVEHQITYARRKGVPWGISESGYYRFDAAMNYQYRGFGMPGLRLRRVPTEDLVISPYASILALSLRPQAVMQNIAQFIELGMLGCYGFYEAMDYTRSRLPPDQRRVIICSYMAHHQGMILLALVNYLHDEVMVSRFHADPRVRSVQLLLQEQIPHQTPVETPHPEEVHAIRRDHPRISIAPWPVPVKAPMPQVHVLSNGRYSVLVTSAGGGYSRWRKVDLTRWRADTTLDNWGTWIYVRDQDSGALWSAGYQPTVIPPASQEVRFHAHQVTSWRRDHDICVRTEITVPPDDVEIRRIIVTNHSDRPRRLTLTSYGEVVLAPHADDRRHQAFGKLFVESEYLPDLDALLFCRRPRSSEEAPIYLAHMLVAEEEREIVRAYESDRARFLGRGGTLRSPLLPVPFTGGDEREGGLSGATLDPIMSLAGEIALKPHATAQVAYVTLAAESRQEALDLALRYQAWSRIERAFDSARSRSELELRRLNLSAPEVERIQQLLSVLIYPHGAARAVPKALAANSRGQSGLWTHGISGDYPILLVSIGDPEEMDLVLELLQAHAYWRSQQVKIDLVILNEREAAYDQELQGQIHRVIARMGSDTWLNQRGGIFVLRADQMSEADRVLLRTAARAILDGGRGPLAEQLRRLRRRSPRLPRFVPTPPSSPSVGGTEGGKPPLGRTEEGEPTSPLARPTDLLFDNGLGGFSADGREYVIYLEPGQWTPAPWINVIANPHFGFLVSEAGSGYTWAENSGENRLTPWRNDPVTDAPGEALYLRDEETAQVWSPTPLPAPAPAPYLVRHGAGYSVFEHHSHGLKQRLRLFAVRDAPVKVIQLRLENTWSRARRITATFYAEWVLGTAREVTQQYIIPEFDADSNALLARNPYNEEFGERVAFAAASNRLHGLTADRTEFLGREGSRSHPAALGRIGLAGTVRAGLDPCAVLQVHLDLAPGEVQEIFFLLGQGADRQEALGLIAGYRDAARVEAAWEDVVKSWNDLLGTVTVQTPDPAMDLMLNRWLLYQTLACRVWGRSALYQSSGAFGYRDQLQDVMALIHTAPGIVRDHILETAHHQFEAGDVLHWWHPPSGRGIRTRCSDDLLWLPFVTAHYVATTGDETILNEQVAFLKGDLLEEGELERYGHYEATAERATLYVHCLRALEKGTTSGSHGLPLIGAHDWNDGLNRVGIEGKGESVWLGWFLYATLNRFAPLCERMGDAERAGAYRQRAQELRQALEQHAWDWGWYRRAYYDDGTLLGSSESDEAKIDSIAQSWAVLSGAAEPARAARAMEAVARHLVRLEDRLILLLTPPFDKTAHDPGYIKGYPPGVRENGGQYTHAALWAVWAFAELGQGDRAEELFRLLNPIYHGDAPEKVARYRVEPYVVAADVYSVEPHVGRGGWTWYTGSAGWMYRLGLEAILGLRRVGGALQINPCIPKHWPGYELTYRNGETSYHIRVENPDGVNLGVRRVTLDGEDLSGGEIPLLGDGLQHEVRVLMG
jgi:cyclic beta-1,2-glucan synthetase